MKKTIFILSATLFVMASAVQAQNATGRTTFGFRAGVNFQNLNGKFATGDKTDFKLKTGYHVGANAEIPVAPDYFVQPGLLYSKKGAKSNNGDIKYNINYIEVPVNFLYKPSLGDGRLLLGFGPYLGVGIGGEVDHGTTDVEVNFQNEVTGSDPIAAYYARRIDAGANLLAGYELGNKLSIQLNAQLGLLKVNPKDERYFADDKTSYKNTGFGVSLGYRL